jgi:hypothetical protein
MVSSNTRPSAAMIVAVVALSLALVGTAIAAPDALTSKITKSKVKQIAKKQATKAIDAREAGLNVNSAKTADSADTAATATDAASVSGNKIVQIDFRPAGAATQTILDLDGLQMVANCNGTNDAITATTTGQDGEIYFHTVRAGLSDTQGDDDDFDAGDVIDLHPGQTSRELIGEIRYVSGTGQAVVVQWGSGGDIPGAVCLTFGYAIGR